MVAVPDFDAAYDGALTDLKERLSAARKEPPSGSKSHAAEPVGAVLNASSRVQGTDQAETIAALLTMNGGAARVQREGKHGNAVLSYRNTLPDDLTPLLVLDASARVRATYSLMERRGDVQRLPTAEKDY